MCINLRVRNLSTSQYTYVTAFSVEVILRELDYKCNNYVYLIH